MVSRRCTAVCKDDTPCRAWAVHGTEPPRCASHGGTGQSGALSTQRWALRRGEPSVRDLPEDCEIDAVIDMLYQRELQLDEIIEQLWECGVSVEEVSRLLRVHGQNAERLGRLLRDRRALSGKAADGISGAMAQALDELSTELGVDL